MASSGSIVLDMNQNAAYDRALSILRATGAELTFQTPPNKVEFSVQKSEWGFKIACEGEATISPLPDGKSNVVIEVSASKNTMMYAIVTEIVLFAFMWFLLGIFGLLIAIVGGVWMFWSYVIDFPEKTFKKIRVAGMQEVPVVSREAKLPVPSAGNTKFCISCGKTIVLDASFCQYCGKKQP